ncbi:MAG: FG-GAP-like repeat-containing protein, partial [Oryzihumus sp.]
MKATERTVPFQARSLTSMGLTGRAPVTRQAASAPKAASAVDPATTARAAALAPVQDVNDGVAVVGVSWPRGSDVSATDAFQIRTLTGDTWSAWQTLDRDESHSADGAEAAAAHPATQPYVVAGASSFEVRALAADGTAPTQASVEVVDPGTSDADSDVSATPPGSAAAAAGKPTIYTRAQWGADESIRKGSPEYGQVQVGFVHHTDGTNSYTASQVPSIIRGIYAYHVNGNGWNDIGYNFLVDRFGRIWEGRYGGMDRSVVGAHTIGYNSWSFGASAIGNFQSTTPPSAMVDAYKRLFAWKLSLSGIPVYGTVSTNGHTFNRVSGHRDEAPTFSTSCPGDRLYAQLSSIRAGASSLMGTLTPSAIQRNVDRSGTSDVLSYAGALTPSPVNGPVTVLKSASPQPVRAGVAIGSGWNVLRGATLTPDLTGDGLADVVAQDPQGNRLRIYAGNGRGGFSGVAYKGVGWNVMTSVLAAGDRDRDGRNDLLAVNKNGDLTFYPGDGRGWVSGGQVIGRGWTMLSSITPAGDLNGDGWPDLLATRTSDGAQVMYAGTAGGGVKQGVVWGRGWNVLTAVVGGADLDTDGKPDIIARDGSGHMRTYYSGT